MKQKPVYNLTVQSVANHYGISARTIRTYLQLNYLSGVRIGGHWRISWMDVWAIEQGPMPRGTRSDDYKKPLMTKRQVADLWNISERTVERWIASGLPTRNVFGNVRIAPVDAEAWFAMRCKPSK